MDRDNPYRWDSSNDEEPQQALSQRLSQLSTEEVRDPQHESQKHGKKRSHSNGTPSTPTTTLTKRSRTDDATIPDYLQLDQRLFQERIVDLIAQWNLTVSVEEVQSIALLKHRIASASLEHQLWTAYLAVGTGHSAVGGSDSDKKNIVDQRFWPACVIEKQQAAQQSCETIVCQQLADLLSSMKQYEEELQASMDRAVDRSDDLEQAIDQYVEDYGLRPVRMRTHYLLKKLEFDRDLEIHEREGLQRQPTEYQVRSIYQEHGEAHRHEIGI